MVQLCEYDVLYSIVLLNQKGDGRFTKKHKWGREGKKYQLKITF